MKIISKRGRVKNQLMRHTPSVAECKEMLRCMKDPKYFIENYVQINTRNGVQLMTLTDDQIGILSSLQTEDNVSAKLPRQAGLTTLSLAFLLWEFLFNNNHAAMAIGLNAHMAVDLNYQFKAMLGHLPGFMLPEITVNRKDAIGLKNGSIIHFTSYESYARGACRGYTLNRVYMDSLSYASEKLQDAMFPEVQMLVARKCKILMASTTT